MIIYLIANTINDKVYVGQTTRELKVRWREHLRNAKKLNTPLQKAMYSLGSSNFYIKKIDTADKIEELNKKEEYWINRLKCMIYQKGYNLKKGGFNKEYSDYSKKKISKSNKGRAVSEETRKKISEASLRMWSDKSFREKHSERVRKALNKRETRKKISEASLRMWSRKGFKERSSGWKKRSLSEEVKENIKNGKRKQLKNPFKVFKAIKVNTKDNRKSEYEKGDLVGIWENQIACANDLKLGRPHHISSCLSKRKKQYKNYIFERIQLIKGE